MKKLSAIFLCSALTSCMVGPDYEIPKLDLDQTWNQLDIQSPKGSATNDALKIKMSDAQPAPEAVDNKPAPAPEPAFARSEWWQNFNDPVLNQLIDQADKNNYDLKTAQARVKEARANRLSATAALLPKVSAQANGARVKVPGFDDSKAMQIYEADFDASWELDLFGGQRRKREAAVDKLEQAKADLQDTLISLRAEVARNYMEVRNFQNQTRITEENIGSQQKSLNLTTSQRNSGTVSDLDVTQANSVYLTTKSHLPTLKTSLEQAKNNLAVLLGEKPGQLDAVLNKPQTVPVAGQKFLIDTPTEVIRNRPDVKSAERALAAATAMQGAAFADYFPKLSLTGFFGYTQAPIAAPGATWALLASPSIPLIDFGRVRAEVHVADAEQEIAFNNFQKSVLQALSEVQNNLVAYVNEENRRAELAEVVANNKRTVELSRARYNSGTSAFTDVLLAQGQLYEVQSQLAQSEANVAEDLIALNKSLGR